MRLSPFRFLILYVIVGWLVVWLPAVSAQPAPSEEQALAQVLAMPDDTNKVQALLKGALAMRENTTRLQTARSALRLSRSLHHTRGEARCYNMLGTLHKNNNQIDSARLYYGRALRLARAIGDSSSVAAALQNRGFLYHKEEKLDSAVFMLLQGITRYESLGKTSSTGGAWLDLSLCYLKMKLFDRALEATKRAEAITRTSNDIRNTAAALTYRSRIYCALQRFAEAEPPLAEAVAITKSTPDPHDEVPALSAYGDFLNDTRQYAKAVRTFSELLQHPLIAEMPLRQAQIHNKLAYALMHNRQFAEAKQALVQAQTLLGATQNATTLDNAQYWTRFYLLQTPGGITYFDRYLALEDSMLGKEKAQMSLELQTRYETAKKDKQLAEQRVQLLEAENRKVMLFAALILLVLLAGVAVWLYRTNRFKERTNRQLEKLNTELNTLNGVKDRLLSLIAHDLRSPLSALSASVQLFQRGRVQPERMTAFADEMQQALANTVGMMDTLLQWSRSQMQGIFPRPVPIVVASLADEVRQMAEVIAAPKQIAIDCGDVDEAARVLADPNMLRIVLYNLVNNAVKFTDSNGLVAIRTEEAGPGKLALVVQDTGVGMTAAQLASIGKRMESTRGTAGERGTGLGLEMVHRFVEANGGTLTFASTLGEGTTATVVLPATAPDALAG